METKVIAEIGINHNGDVDLAKEMILIARAAGCQYVKLQKRDPDICVPEKQKLKPKSTPWGEMTYLDYKKKIEFSADELSELADYAKSIGIELFCSVWDIESAQVYLDSIGSGIVKIPSAKINDLDLITYCRKYFDFLIISTGMSYEDEIERAVSACSPDVIMHTCSAYPSPPDQINLNYILHLKKKFPGHDIGYSGHEYGLIPTINAVAMGAKWVERHITTDREMWGSDQAASVEPHGLFRLVKYIQETEKTLGEVGPRRVLKCEREKRDSLRGDA